VTELGVPGEFGGMTCGIGNVDVATLNCKMEVANDFSIQETRISGFVNRGHEVHGCMRVRRN